MRERASAVAALFLLVSGTVGAREEVPVPDPARLDQVRRALDEGRCQAARADPATALAEDPAGVRYNLARCLERAGDRRGALDAYLRFVDGDADPGEIAAARARIADLEAILARSPVEVPVPVPAPAPQPQLIAPARPNFVAPILVGAVSLAAFGAQLALHLAFVDQLGGTAPTCGDPADCTRKLDLARPLVIAIYSTMAVGIAGLAADVALWVRAARARSAERRALAPSLSAGTWSEGQ